MTHGTEERKELPDPILDEGTEITYFEATVEDGLELVVYFDINGMEHAASDQVYPDDYPESHLITDAHRRAVALLICPSLTEDK